MLELKENSGYFQPTPYFFYHLATKRSILTNIVNLTMKELVVFFGGPRWPLAHTAAIQSNWATAQNSKNILKRSLILYVFFKDMYCVVGDILCLFSGCPVGVNCSRESSSQLEYPVIHNSLIDGLADRILVGIGWYDTKC